MNHRHKTVGGVREGGVTGWRYGAMGGAVALKCMSFKYVPIDDGNFARTNCA